MWGEGEEVFPGEFYEGVVYEEAGGVFKETGTMKQKEKAGHG